jgi:hypothetical protein
VVFLQKETHPDEHRQAKAISWAARTIIRGRDAADHITAQINYALMRRAVRSQSGIPDPANRPESIGWSHAL